MTISYDRGIQPVSHFLEFENQNLSGMASREKELRGRYWDDNAVTGDVSRGPARVLVKTDSFPRTLDLAVKERTSSATTFVTRILSTVLDSHGGASMAQVDIDQIDGSMGRKVIATHQLDGLLLFQALSRIQRAGSLPMNMFLRADGIGIPGHITDPDGRLHMDLGRIVEGSLIGEEPKNIYLQVFEYDDAPNGVPDIDLPKLLKEYLEPSKKAVELIEAHHKAVEVTEAHQTGLVSKLGRVVRRMIGSR